MKRAYEHNPRVPWGLYFADDATSGDVMPTDWTHVAITLEDLSNGAARVSAQYDINEKHSYVSQWWRWRANFEFDSASVAGNITRLYIAGADDSSAAHVDGSLGVSNAAVADVDYLANCDNFGNVDGIDLAAGCVSSGLVRFVDRYVSLAVKNDSGQNMIGVGLSWVKMWPVPEIEVT